jgi:hypothetical protein
LLAEKIDQLEEKKLYIEYKFSQRHQKEIAKLDDAQKKIIVALKDYKRKNNLISTFSCSL